MSGMNKKADAQYVALTCGKQKKIVHKLNCEFGVNSASRVEPFG